MSTMIPILREIQQELERQNYKFGQQDHNPVEWIAILSEELGEAAKEAVDHHFSYKPKEIEADEWDQRDQLYNKVQIARLTAYRKELVQVAAVAVQMISSLDRNT